MSTSLSLGANPASETFHGVFSIPAGVSVDSMNAYLEVRCLIATCDFSNTGDLTLDPLPNGVSFTSSSGVLLTAPGNDAPEPGTWGLSLCAMAVLVASRRRKPLHR